MRFIAAYLLIFSVILPVSSLVVWLAHHKYEVQERLEHKLLFTDSEVDIVTLTFSLEEAKTYLEWEHEREFQFQGEMYDIIEHTITADSVRYRCIWDHAETKVKKQLEALVSGALQQDEQHREVQLSIHKLFMSLFFEDSNDWQSETMASLIDHFAKWKAPFSEKVISCHTPPPDLL